MLLLNWKKAEGLIFALKWAVNRVGEY